MTAGVCVEDVEDCIKWMFRPQKWPIPNSYDRGKGGEEEEEEDFFLRIHTFIKYVFITNKCIYYAINIFFSIMSFFYKL